MMSKNFELNFRLRTFGRLAGLLACSAFLVSVLFAGAFVAVAQNTLSGMQTGMSLSGMQTGTNSNQPGSWNSDQNSGSNGASQAGPMLQSSMYAESLVLFLEHHVDMLIAVRYQLATAIGSDPQSISDQQVFSRIRQDPGLDDKVMQILQKRGYSISDLGLDAPPMQQQTMPFQQNQLGQNQPGQNQPGQNPQFVPNLPPTAIVVLGGVCPAGYAPLGGNGALPGSNTAGAASGLGWQGGNSTASSLGTQGAANLASALNAAGGMSGLGNSSAVSSALNTAMTGMNGQANLQQPGQSSTQMYSQQGLSGGSTSQGTLICIQTQVNPGQPVLRQRQLPYQYIESLYDLYMQVQPADNSTLKRFGSDVFLLGTGNSEQLPMDLPAGPDYVLGSGDILNINLWGSQTFSLSAMVDRQGQITLPEVGSVMISGITISAAQNAIRQNLHTQFKDMHVEISLGRVHTVRVYVVGDVQRPGAYDISSLSTPLSALYSAGGPTASGSLRLLRHYRGKQLVADIDLYDFLLHGVRSLTEHLQSGDTLLVPPVGAQVTINGMVRRPAIYELKGGETLKDAIEMAGGVAVDASLARVTVERVEAHQHRTAINVQVAEQTDPGKSAIEAPELTALHMQDGDSVQIRSIAPYNQSAVFLDGHVYHPGKYAYHEGMTVSDLLHSSQDMMPEPASRIELVRLAGADYHPETTLLELKDILQGNSPVLLRPFDFIRVFSRYEVDVPMVTIAGEVIRPGDYPMSDGMRATDLVRMAGGFRRSAYSAEADLVTYAIEGGKSVLRQTRVIAMDRALGGDASADVQLKPGDILSVRQIGGWQDIGSAVTVSGEVTNAGTFGIVEGERLSSVLKRAGGFRNDAFPQGILFQRDSARMIAENARQEMIQRIQSLDLSSQMSATSGSSQSQTEMFQMMRSQQQEVLASLRATPANGRVVVKIGSDISKWENTSTDIRLEANDTIFIPKRNEIVAVVGQVYAQTSLTYVRGKDVRWYLQQAGGPTRSAERSDIYVIRADGSHISRKGFLGGASVMSSHLQPGDTIVVPEKIMGTSVWQTIFQAAQAMIAPATLAIAAAKL
jgi:protein involved in polysaccharide export with SLBB domain